MQLTSSWRRSYSVLVTATLITVALADFLFYDHVLGWTAAAFTFFLLFLLVASDGRFLRSAGGWIALVALLGLLYSLIEQPTWLNIPYALLCLTALVIISRTGWQRNVSEWIAQWTSLFLSGIVRLFADNRIASRWVARRGLSPRATRGLAAWILPLLLGVIFIILFAIANPVISQWLTSFRDWINRTFARLPEYVNPVRIFFWLAFALLSWTLLRGRVRRRRSQSFTTTADTYVIEPISLDLPPGFVVRCLIVFNAIFIVQNALDARFLADPSKLPPGMGYTEYVHRGAYPLIAAALLAGTFVITMFRPNSRTERSRAARWLVYGWLAQTIFLTLSASWRLGQYIDLTALTRWRLASAIWFALVALGLIYTIIRIVTRRSDQWLININALTTALVLYVCCFIHFDRVIADYNVRHCREIDPSANAGIDIAYVQELGPSSLPALLWLEPQLKDPDQHSTAVGAIRTLRRELHDELSDWRGWTLRRWRISRQSDVVSQITASSCDACVACAI
jgi:hypothetical protein